MFIFHFHVRVGLQLLPEQKAGLLQSNTQRQALLSAAHSEWKQRAAHTQLTRQQLLLQAEAEAEQAEAEAKIAAAQLQPDGGGGGEEQILGYRYTLIDHLQLTRALSATASASASASTTSASALVLRAPSPERGAPPTAVVLSRGHTPHLALSFVLPNEPPLPPTASARLTPAYTAPSIPPPHDLPAPLLAARPSSSPSPSASHPATSTSQPPYIERHTNLQPQAVLSSDYHALWKRPMRRVRTPSSVSASVAAEQELTPSPPPQPPPTLTPAPPHPQLLRPPPLITSPSQQQEEKQDVTEQQHAASHPSQRRVKQTTQSTLARARQQQHKLQQQLREQHKFATFTNTASATTPLFSTKHFPRFAAD